MANKNERKTNSRIIIKGALTEVCSKQLNSL